MNNHKSLKNIEIIFNNAYKNLINNNLDIAEEEYLQCLSLEYKVFDTLCNLGFLYREKRDYIKTEHIYLKILDIKDDYVDAYLQLADLYLSLNYDQEAINFYKKALSINPSIELVYVNLGVLYKKQNKMTDALVSYLDGLLINSENIALQYNLSNIITQRTLPNKFLKLESTEKLLKSCLSFKNNEYQSFLTATLGFLCDKFELDGVAFDNERGYLLLDNLLFQLALRKLVITNLHLEHFLTKVRKEILNGIVNSSSSKTKIPNLESFIVSLSIQCFWTEYIYAIDDDEIELLKNLQTLIENSIKQKNKTALLYIALYGCYKPLFLEDFVQNNFYIQQKEKKNIHKELFRIQVEEPLEEKRLKKNIACFIPLDDEISMKVAQQYEENPYPRWISNKKPIPISINGHILTQVPLLKKLASLYHADDKIDILIAGSGTGRHPINVSQLIENSNVVGVDLSKSSIAYAQRKTNELGIKNLKFYQGDILNLNLIDTKFDLIESVGVLHHMNDPLKGWEILVSILKENGYMKIGLYSELARKSIVDTLSFIEEKGYQANLEDIRKCRSDIGKLDPSHPMYTLITYNDFYSTSETRDLIFNIQEHRFTIPEIEKILAALNLVFLGFTFTKREINQKFLEMFPDDKEAKSLKNWHIFELEYPDTFIEMYQMWLQKIG